MNKSHYTFSTEPEFETLLKIANFTDSLGHILLETDSGYSLNEIKAKLTERGPSYFLNMHWLQEDISPKAPLKAAETYVAERLSLLGSPMELIITDPYIFPSARRNDPHDYSQSVVRILDPLLSTAKRLEFVVDPKNVCDEIRDIVANELKERHEGLEIAVTHSDAFHDRFWIADRQNGIILGTSLNKVGNKIFFMDALSSSDVKAVVKEIEALSGA